MIHSGEEFCTTILLELLSNPNASMLLLDPFGNFVVQSALSASKVRYPTSLQLGNSNINNSNLCFDVVDALGCSRCLNSIVSGLGTFLYASP